MAAASGRSPASSRPPDGTPSARSPVSPPAAAPPARGDGSRLFILTGASRGLGAAIAAQLLGGSGTTLLGLSRSVNASLADAAATHGTQLEQWPVDLVDPAPVAERLERWLAGFDPDRFAAATLVNNAALVARVGPLESTSSAELSRALRASLEAPLLLTAAFLRATAAWPGDRRILNVSSGLGRRAMAGAATYCASKAGLDHLARALALEQQAGSARPARIVSLAPGVIDTDMQVQLRGADAAGFPERGTFTRLHETGQLTAAGDAAARVLAYLARADFGQTPVADVRDP